MTRAISISAPPEVVWSWLAQMGRGAGWYSHDRIDNGGRASARHIVSWIPAPLVGDAAAIGWLRNVEPGRGLTWWMPGDEALGTTMRMVTDVRLEGEGAGSRLVVRISGDAEGLPGPLVVRGFEAVDSIMAIRQLRGIKRRAESFGARTADPAAPETGARDQFQLYETIWVSGGRAGSVGREKAAAWRRDAEAAGVLDR
jgi:carbon monoxide dehydrogenase subunit G